MRSSPNTRRPPTGWNPRREIMAFFPAMVDLCRAVLPEVRAIQARLDCDEARGLDTSCLHQALKELRWRLEYTSDAVGVRANLDRIRILAAVPEPLNSGPDEEGSYG